MLSRRAVFLLLLSAIAASSQKPEYDFYPEFRGWLQQVRRENRSLARAQIMERYTAEMKSQGVSDSEIARRIDLAVNSRDQLEDDFWNRFFTQGKANYNTAPNSFLEEVVAGRKPGAALDYGMGEGRNAIFLTRLGWKVSGFDPASEAVALAQKRAKALGFTLDTATVRDSNYDFGKDRFDLVLFSWTMTQPRIRPQSRRLAQTRRHCRHGVRCRLGRPQRDAEDL